MSKPQDNMLPYVMAGIGVIGSFIGITTFFNSPVKEVKADLEILKVEVVQDRVEVGKNISAINTNIGNIKDTLDEIKKKLR